jgi:FkbM family methyltransferase
MKKIFINILKFFNIGIVRYTNLVELRANKSAKNKIDLLMELPSEKIPKLIKYLNKSHSQLNQDLFVLSQLNFKKGGYFVEFGATDGVELSNTYLLEMEFDWSGILAEPAKYWHKKLKDNRKANIEYSCVWKNTGSVLSFNEIEIPELSTLLDFSSNDSHHSSRKRGKTYEVKTISLLNLLQKYNAPKIIDYLSLDTEGSEYEILENFDFSEYQFRIITCEHNFTPMRDKINNLLTRNGYKRVLSTISEFDDWYIKESLIS